MRLRSGRRSTTAMLGALLATLTLPASIAAGGCHLIVTSEGGSPAAVDVGDAVTVEGFGFAPGDVEVAIAVDGTPVRTSIATAADAFGNVGYFGLEFVVDAAGFWELTATEVAGTCSATDGFPVRAAAPVPTPSAAPVVPNVATTAPRTAPWPAWVAGGTLLMLGVLRAGSQRRAATRR